MTQSSHGERSPAAEMAVGAGVAQERAVGLPYVGVAAAPMVDAPRSWLSSLYRDLAPQDWLLLAYFGLLLLGVLFGAGPDRLLAGEIVVGLALVLVGGLALTRGGVLRREGFANAMVYRLAIFLSCASSYFALRVILPASAPRSVDAALYAFDLQVFHYEPALAWDRFATPPVVEWFSFFYFGYFVLLAVHVLPFMLAAKNMAMLARFAMATYVTFCCGHLLYIVVPGFGPHAYLVSSFSHPLEGGLFWRLVLATVDGAGAQKDIFPSIHTAIPATFFLLAMRYRREFFWYRISAPIVGFCTLQMVIATMLLRWHYLVDICAGLALAAISVRFTDWVIRWDEARRERLGLAAAWRPLRWRG